MKKIILSILLGLLCLEPTTHQAMFKKPKKFNVRVKLSGLHITAFGLEKTIPAFQDENIDTMEKLVTKTHSVLSWVHDTNLGPKLAKFLSFIGAKKTKEKIINFLEKQRKKITRNRIKLSIYRKIGIYANYIPWLASSFLTAVILKKTSYFWGTIAAAGGFTCSKFSGPAIKKLLKRRLDLLEKFIETEKLLEQMIATFKNETFKNE